MVRNQLPARLVKQTAELRQIELNFLQIREHVRAVKTRLDTRSLLKVLSRR